MCFTFLAKAEKARIRIDLWRRPTVLFPGRLPAEWVRRSDIDIQQQITTWRHLFRSRGTCRAITHNSTCSVRRLIPADSVSIFVQWWRTEKNSSRRREKATFRWIDRVISFNGRGRPMINEHHSQSDQARMTGDQFIVTDGQPVTYCTVQVPYTVWGCEARTATFDFPCMLFVMLVCSVFSKHWMLWGLVENGCRLACSTILRWCLRFLSVFRCNFLRTSNCLCLTTWADTHDVGTCLEIMCYHSTGELRSFFIADTKLIFWSVTHVL